MSKKDKVTQIIGEISEQAEELVDDDNTELMSAEEIVILSTELVTGGQVTSITYSSPLAEVDRSRMSFMLDDEYEFPIYGAEEIYEEDS